MDEVLTRLAATPLAEWMRLSRWGYAGVNTLHVLGIALLVGAIVPLDLRLLGLRRHIGLADAASLLQPLAITGLLLAAISGVLLFLADPHGYAATPLFLLKLLLVLMAVSNALALNFGAGLTRASTARLRLLGALSLVLWLLVLCAGRFLAFV
ncbi:hypothetical protein [Halomonas korlensis]|uniref:DUF2214 domain-containing protein n=1 Tax=Halomonas korlensis TaxID=463301 RepID=A0A1I7H046_9GAMM|nr:hypothetical protein [Halomonas korlensis]SFU54081.1 hypothetical protein SAMN04487955_103373 [Halomonas korlensis]